MIINIKNNIEALATLKFVDIVSKQIYAFVVLFENAVIK